MRKKSSKAKDAILSAKKWDKPFFADSGNADKESVKKAENLKSYVWT